MKMDRQSNRPKAEVLTPEQTRSWRHQGYCIIEASDSSHLDLGWVITKEEALRYRTAARTAVLGNGNDVPAIPDLRNFGGLGFPFFGRRSEPLNDLALHPRLLAASAQLLGLTKDETVLLSQAECWVKRDRVATTGAKQVEVPDEYVNTDQRMHCDFPNHYLTVPPPWDKPEAVAMIVYLDESSECGGETACVAREGPHDSAYVYPPMHMPGFGNVPWINDRTLAEKYLHEHHQEAFLFRDQLYKREVRVRYKVGTILLYRLDLWHRGTPLLPNMDRAVINLLYKRPDAKHITSWHRGWAQNAYNAWGSPRIYPPEVGRFEQLLMSLSPCQRAALGFPAIGDAYWTPETVRAVKLRFPNMDMSPYQAGSKL